MNIEQAIRDAIYSAVENDMEDVQGALWADQETENAKDGDYTEDRAVEMVSFDKTEQETITIRMQDGSVYVVTVEKAEGGRA